jgi:secreted PhoX family phosphatase
MALSRRQFFTLAGASAAGTVLMSPLKALYAQSANGQSIRGEGYGALIPDPNGLLDLPRGFRYRAFSRTGDLMSDGNPVPAAHDGMAAFAGSNNTTILVRNHELSPGQLSTPRAIAPANKQYDQLCRGGTTTLVVGSDRKLVKHYVSLAGTYRNCAGGPTPWGSWISCEETTATNRPFTLPDDPQTTLPQGTNRPGDPNNVSKPHGYNFEVPSTAEGPVDPVPLVAMGRFNHEAIAVDPTTGIVYETEDAGDGLFYRFIPKVPGVLRQGGTLQALKIKGMPQAITKVNFPVGQPMAVEWVTIDDPDPAGNTVKVEGFAKGAAQFTRGEGTWFGNNEVYFTCTDGGEARLGQVWRYVPDLTGATGGTIELFAEPSDQSLLERPDNITVAPFGDLIICEDGPDEQFVRGITQQGRLYNFARNALNTSEFAGACFSPDGQTMFVNIQTPGITFAVWGPWERRRS